MSNPYSKPSISGYNSNPPPDDGTSIAQNEITWAKHKDKLGDPVKNYADAINTATFNAFADIFLNSVSSHSANYTVLTSDQGALLDCQNTITITLLSASSAGTGFPLAIRNAGSGIITVDGSGAETVNGSATINLDPGGWIIITSDGSNWSGPQGVTKASQAEVTAGTEDSKFVTPLTLKGIKASQADVDAGTDTKKYITSQTLAAGNILRPYSAVIDAGRVSDISSCFNQDATYGSIYIDEVSSKLVIKIDLYHPYNDQSIGYTRTAGSSLTLYEGIYTVLLPAGMVLEHYLNGAWYTDAVFDGSAQKAGTFTAIIDSPHASRLRNTTGGTLTYYMMMAQLYG